MWSGRILANKAKDRYSWLDARFCQSLWRQHIETCSVGREYWLSSFRMPTLWVVSHSSCLLWSLGNKETICWYLNTRSSSCYLNARISEVCERHTLGQWHVSTWYHLYLMALISHTRGDTLVETLVEIYSWRYLWRHAHGDTLMETRSWNCVTRLKWSKEAKPSVFFQLNNRWSSQTWIKTMSKNSTTVSKRQEK